MSAAMGAGGHRLVEDPSASGMVTLWASFASQPIWAADEPVAAALASPISWSGPVTMTRGDGLAASLVPHLRLMGTVAVRAAHLELAPLAAHQARQPLPRIPGRHVLAPVQAGPICDGSRAAAACRVTARAR